MPEIWDDIDIIAAAGQTPEGQTHVKKVISEMGGKNAIVVDQSADLDEAVLGVRSSAFGYQGQKCSACARAIVLDPVYDLFLGHKTLRLHGLVEKVPSSAELIGRTELVAWAERLIGPLASSVLLNAGELIQIQPGEPAQYPHRDSDSWPVPIGEDPIIVNAIVALDPCTLENGATYVAPGSWQWEPKRQARADEFARAVMDPGDAVLFRGDLIHGGGENASVSPVVRMMTPLS